MVRVPGSSRLVWPLALAVCGQPPAADETSAAGSSSSSSSTATSTSTASTTAPTSAPTTSDDGPTTAPNGLPPAPTLVSPTDGATQVALVTALCWDLVDDPDGDPLRYRVFIDEQELTEGTLGDHYGHDGPCTPPLNFVLERSYTWRVEAFEVADPARSSPSSATWTFTTLPDGLSTTVFVDEFEDDAGWQVSGDVGSGAWVRGLPVPAFAGQDLSQPGHCQFGLGCWFTGQNPDGLPAMADVAGGTTTLTSPPFDLGGAAAATVQLGRFFYKSEAASGPQLLVELLVPRPDQPGEYDARPLELLDAATADDPQNLWHPREYVACGAPLRDGSRLRISATDEGAGLLEAAIDHVKVRAHDDTTVCTSGEGGACDPAAGPAACQGDLLCCARGVINEGVFRCDPPVPGLVFGDPTPTPDAPGNGPPGCDAPDLIVDGFLIDPIFAEIMIAPDTCELFEGCVGGLGMRRVMLFTTATPNIGSMDLVMGVPANHPELFHYSECHDHYHFDEFARYQLLDGDTVVATGHKQAFCMLDTISWAWPNELSTFTCANQGISRGFSDFYDAGLPCQWVDVTDVPPGDYTLSITLNQPRPHAAVPVLNERDYGNNALSVAVTIPP